MYIVTMVDDEIFQILGSEKVSYSYELLDIFICQMGGWVNKDLLATLYEKSGR